VTLVDVDPDRAGTAAALGVGFAAPEEAPGDLDLVVHTSATAAGLQRCLELVGTDGTVVELSWYGDRPVELRLGGDFHARRLGIKASQVGAVAAVRRSRRTPGQRLDLALELLRDPAFDALLTGRSPFAELPGVLAAMGAGDLPGLCHTVDYDEEEPCSA
jgi:threonine dehydrogenase-like Zn-dependent dehydrogenase